MHILVAFVLWTLAIPTFCKAKSWHRKAEGLRKDDRSIVEYYPKRDKYHNKRDAFACLTFVLAICGTAFFIFFFLSFSKP